MSEKQKTFSPLTAAQNHSWGYLWNSFPSTKEQFRDAEIAQSDQGDSQHLELQRKRMKETIKAMDREADLEAGPLRQSDQWKELMILFNQFIQVENEILNINPKLIELGGREKKLNNELQRLEIKAISPDATVEDIERGDEIKAELAQIKEVRRAVVSSITDLRRRRKQLLKDTIRSFHNFKSFAIKNLISPAMEELKKAEEKYREASDQLGFIFDSALPAVDMVVSKKFPAPGGSARRFPGTDEKSKVNVTRPVISEFWNDQLTIFEKINPPIIRDYEYIAETGIEPYTVDDPGRFI
jgi:hypothetical protein